MTGLLDRYGSVEVGKQADLVLLGANPLENIRATSVINAVVLRGELQDRAALDKLLSAAKAEVARRDADAAK